jgi:pimeloyl-ACP methyl ester carboxylesterase
MIDDPRGSIDYDERGRGPTVVLVPGSCSTGAAWRPVIAALDDRFRCITTSLLGYGGTAERRSPDDCSISHEVDMLEAVVRRAAAPVHLVGHSFGGLAALAFALHGRAPLASLTVLEAPLVELLRERGQDRHHYRAFREMTDGYFAAFASGDGEAIRLMIDFYGGSATFASWPQRFRAYAMETTAVNIRDWHSAFGFPLSSAIVRSIDIPCLVAFGERSHPAARHANSLLSTSLPTSTAVELSGAAHFMISTHAGEVARAISDHVGRSGRWAASASAGTSLIAHDMAGDRFGISPR